MQIKKLKTVPLMLAPLVMSTITANAEGTDTQYVTQNKTDNSIPDYINLNDLTADSNANYQKMMANGWIWLSTGQRLSDDTTPTNRPGKNIWSKNSDDDSADKGLNLGDGNYLPSKNNDNQKFTYDGVSHVNVMGYKYDISFPHDKWKNIPRSDEKHGKVEDYEESRPVYIGSYGTTIKDQNGKEHTYTYGANWGSVMFQTNDGKLNGLGSDWDMSKDNFLFLPPFIGDFFYKKAPDGNPIAVQLSIFQNNKSQNKMLYANYWHVTKDGQIQHWFSFKNVGYGTFTTVPYQKTTLSNATIADNRYLGHVFGTDGQDYSNLVNDNGTISDETWNTIKPKKLDDSQYILAID